MGGDGVRAGVGCDGDALGMGMCWGWRNAVPAAHPTAPPDGFGGGSGGWGGSVRQIPPPLYSLMMSGERAMKGNCRAALCHPTRRADRSQCERSMSPPSHSPRAPRGVRGGAWGGGHKAESPQVWGGDGEGARCAHPPPSSHPRSPPHPAPVSMQGSSRSAPPAIPMLLFYGVRHTHTHVCTRVHEGGGREPVGVRRVQCTALGRPSALHSRACAVPHTPHRRSAAPCAPQGHTRVCAMHKQSSGGVGGGCVLGGGGSGGDSGGTGSSPGATSNLVCRRRR